jgi:hypothetical protein
MINEGWEKKVGAGWEFVTDPEEMVQKMLARIDQKRKELKLEEYSPTRYRRSATYFPGDYAPDEVFKKGPYSRAGIV